MDYIVHVAINIALYAILGVSFNLLLGYTGLFAVSHAAFFGIGAYASALLALHAGLGFLWGMALGIVVAGLVGAVIALPALRVSGDYLVIVSFGLQTIVFSVMLNWQDVTRGVAGLPGIPLQFRAQQGDVVVHRPRAGEGLVPPHLVQQLVAGDHLAGPRR